MVVGLWLRHAVEESPLFVEAQQRAATHDGHAPLRIVLSRYRKQVLMAALADVGEKATYYTFSIFLLAYLTQVVHVPKSTALTAITIASVFQATAIVLGGALGDRYGRRVTSVLLAGSVAAWALAALPLVDTGNAVRITLVITVGLTLHGLLTGAQAPFFAELFPSEVRYTGASLGYQLATVVGGSMIPLLGIALLRRYPSTLPITFLLCATLACTATAFLWAGETRTRDLRNITDDTKDTAPTAPPPPA